MTLKRKRTKRNFFQHFNSQKNAIKQNDTHQNDVQKSGTEQNDTQHEHSESERNIKLYFVSFCRMPIFKTYFF